MKNKAVRYLVFMCLPALIVGAMLLASYVLLIRAGEFRSTDQIVAWQLENGGLYNSAIDQMSYGYKQSLYKRVKPEVVAVGSSRVMQFQGPAFTTSFVTMGGASSGLIELKKTLEDMFAVHKPELVLVGLDFWWFNDAYIEPARNPSENRYQTQLDVKLPYLIEPWAWIVKGKLPLSSAKDILLYPQKHQGIAPLAKGDGYDRYGTYHYVSETSGLRPNPHVGFKSGLARLARGQRTGVHGADVSKERLQQYDEIIAYLESQDVDFIAFLPPVAPEISDALILSGNHTYVSKLRHMLTHHRRPALDYHDPQKLGGDHCEFIDGIHAGAVFYNRIVLDMALRENSPLRAFVDTLQLSRDIINNQGYATLWPARMFPPRLRETDFLELGCLK